MNAIKAAASKIGELVFTAVFFILLSPFILLAVTINPIHSYFRTRYMKRVASKWAEQGKSVLIVYYPESYFAKYIHKRLNAPEWSHVVLLDVSKTEQTKEFFRDDALKVFDKYFGYEDGYGREPKYHDVFKFEYARKLMQIRALKIDPVEKEKYFSYEWAEFQDSKTEEDFVVERPRDEDFQELEKFVVG
jgi:hypothetical protein